MGQGEPILPLASPRNSEAGMGCTLGGRGQSRGGALLSKLREQSEAAFPLPPPNTHLLIFGCAGSFIAIHAFLLLWQAGDTLVAVHQLLVAVASLVAEPGL